MLCQISQISWLTGKDPDAKKDRGQEEKRKTWWDGWMASSTQWSWVWANSGKQWRTGKPGMLQSMGSQRVGHNWVTELTDWLVVQLFSDVQLWSHGLQHARLPCPSLFPGVCLNWCSIESVMPSNHLILCLPCLLPSIFPSIKVFSSQSAFPIRWPKCWSFSFSISPSNEYSGLLSFRIDWLVSWQSKGLSGVFSNTTVQKH